MLDPNEIIPASEFWADLEDAGVTVTAQYSANGRMRFCLKRDGERFVVSVHKQYPRYMVNKTLEENGFFDVPLYNSEQAKY